MNRHCLLALALALTPALAEAQTVYSYVRSNLDGSEPETIRVWSPDGLHVEVAKMVAPCTDAALVTAEMDRPGGYARSLVGGRLQRDGTQRPVAYLTYNPASGGIEAEVRLPDQTLKASAKVTPGPWHLYDFDLASLTVLGARPAADFAFDMALVWPDAAPEFLSVMGRAEARFIGREQHLGREALKFEVGGPAFKGKGGPLWLDAAGGHVLEARFGVPNHSEYRDFLLTLTGTATVDEAAWRTLLKSHFSGCPLG